MEPLTDPCSDIGKKAVHLRYFVIKMIGPGFDPEAFDYTDPTGHYNDKDDRMHTAQRALLVYMRHLSEENWCAGWCTGLEFILWEWVLRLRGGTKPASKFERASAPDIEVLSWLAELAGGWWHWKTGSKEPEFVPLNEWVEIYRNRPATDYS